MGSAALSKEDSGLRWRFGVEGVGVGCWVSSTFSVRVEDGPGLDTLDWNAVPARLPDPAGAEGSSWMETVSPGQKWLSTTAEVAQ